MGLSSLVKSQAVGGLSADLLVAATDNTTPPAIMPTVMEVDDSVGSVESQIVRQRVFGDGCTRLSNIFIPLPSTTTTSSSGPLSHAHLRRLRLKKRKHSRPISWVEDQVELFRQTTNATGNAMLNRFKILQQIRIAHARRIPSRVRAVEEAFEERRSKTRPLDDAPKVPHNVLQLSQRQLHPIETANWEDFIVYDADEADLAEATMGPWVQVKPVSRTQHGKAFPRPSTLVPAMVQPGSGLVSPLLRPPGAMALNAFSPAPSSALSSVVTSRSGSHGSLPSAHSSTSSLPPAVNNILRVPQCPATRVMNAELMQGRWLDAICWDDDRLPTLLPPLRLILTVSDPTMCLELSTASQAVGQVSAKDLARLNRMIVKAKAKRLPSGSNISLPSATAAYPAKQVNYGKLQVHDPLNLSMDRHYERRRNNKTMVSLEESRPSTATTSATTSRPTIATSLQHSIPALRLCWPQYRTHWSRQEIRRWHRPALAQPVGAAIQNIGGCKPPAQSKKQEALANGLIRSLKRLTLRDCIDYAMVEYAEEFPLAVMNVGMATRITAYHRVRDAEEERIFENRPVQGGMWQRLGPNDPSPFWQFGFLPVGQTQMALSNNLFRVPCWAHPTPPTDFLLIRHCRKGQVDAKWSIRELPPMVLVAGQVMPLQEVPQPHSRRFNQFCRARVQVAAYRQFHRKQKGEEGGAKLKITKLSNMFPQFSDGSMRKWLKEYADSQRAGTGGSGTWSLRADAPRLSEDDLRQLVPPEAVCLYESMLVGQQCLQDAGVLLSGDLGEEDERQEVRMAPWNRTAAFVAACAGKCQLRTGDQDVQLSMIKMPTRLTKQEKERMASDSMIGPDGRLDRQERERMQTSYRQQLVHIWERQLRWLSGNEQPPVEPRPVSPTLADGNRLVITRYQDTPNGTVIETDTLTDPRLIAMYQKARAQWQERRARKRAKEATQSQRKASSVNAGGEEKVKKPRKPRSEKLESKKQLTIRCGTCGQQGHMRTNRICPMYALYEASLLTEDGGAKPPKPPAAPKAPRVTKPKPVPVASLSPAQQLALSRLNNLFYQILTQLSSLPMAWPFAKPVNRKEYPHYYAIIALPIDLASMKTRCKRQAYRSGQAFQNELERIHANCLTFNLSDHPFTGMAWDLIQRGRDLLTAHAAEIARLEREIASPDDNSLNVAVELPDPNVKSENEEVSVE